MSEISETEIKSMTKEQNYMRGYEDGKSDALDGIRAEIEVLNEKVSVDYKMCLDKSAVLQIIDKYKEGANK